MTPFRSFAEQTRRNRFAALARTVPVTVGMLAVATAAPFFGGTFGQWYLSALVASHLVRSPLHRLWWLASAPVFGMRVVADKRGTGRPSQARVDGDRLRVRGAVSWGASLDLAPRAEATSRLRVWLGFAAEVAAFAVLGTAAGLLLPDPWGWAAAAGVALGTLTVVAPYPVSSTPGWFLFAMPFADRAAFDKLKRSTAEVKVEHLLAIGDAAAAAQALTQLDEYSWRARSYNAELAALTLDLDRIGPDIDLAWLAIAPSGPDRARMAQQGARLLTYAREAKLGAWASPEPPSLPSYMHHLHWLAAVGATLAPPHPTTDATALYLLTCGAPGAAAREADRAAYHSRSPVTAAHALCTAAIAYSVARKPEPAARALRQAKELMPELDRIALAQRWVDEVSGVPSAARAGADEPDDPDRDAGLSPDAYRSRYATDEEAWKW